MSFIEVQAVSKAFTVNGTLRHVLEDVNLTVERGEFVSIVGFMGCGKSTFLHLVAGLLQTDSGRSDDTAATSIRRRSSGGRVHVPELLAAAMALGPR